MHPLPPSDQAAVSQGNGCLSGYIIPPLMVVVLSCLLASFTFKNSVDPEGMLVDMPQEVVQDVPVPDRSAAEISQVFTEEVRYWALPIQNWAAAAGLDPDLAATIMQIESCGDPRALSRSGATGLFQVMPYHFLATEDPFDPETNAMRGLDYLRRSLETASGEPRLAMAGYNGGIGVIGNGETSWAAETIRYAYWGSGIYLEAKSGATESLRLQEWLEAGGASLCRQAHTRLGLP